MCGKNDSYSWAYLEKNVDKLKDKLARTNSILDRKGKLNTNTILPSGVDFDFFYIFHIPRFKVKLINTLVIS